MEKRIAVYPGSFDPFHNGHLDIIERSCPLFDEVIVAVLNNTSKKALFTPEERVEMVSVVLRERPTCRVETFSGLLVHFMDEVNARTSVRGLRAVSDFESEFQMALMNRHLDPRVETIFLTSNQENMYLSSRLIKEIYLLGGELKDLVPEPIFEYLRRRAQQPEDV